MSAAETNSAEVVSLVDLRTEAIFRASVGEARDALAARCAAYLRGLRDYRPDDEVSALCAEVEAAAADLGKHTARLATYRRLAGRGAA